MTLDYRRDRYGNPLVAHPTIPDDELSYKRPSGYGDVLDDKYALGLWKQRKTAEGAALRKDLLAQIAATAAETGKGVAARLDKLVEECIEAAGGNEGRRLGDALHSYIKMVNSGLNPVVLEPWDRDVDAYKQALLDHGFEIVPTLVEVAIINDAFKVAGSADFFLRKIATGRVYGADLKTGKTSPTSNQYGVQLYLYITGQLYDVEAGTRSPIHADLDTSVGYLFHAPAGTGTCHVIEVDMAVAGARAELAHGVRNVIKDVSYMRTVKPTTASTDAPVQASVEAAPITVSAAVDLPTRFATIVAAEGGKAILGQLWTEAGISFAPKHLLGAIEADSKELPTVHAVIAKAEDLLSLPFTQTLTAAPAPEPEPTVKRTKVRKKLDEGGTCSTDAVQVIADWLHNADTDVQTVAKKIATDAKDAGTPISLATNKTVRRFELARAIKVIADASWGMTIEETLDALLDLIDAPEAPTVGARLGKLDARWAKDLALAANNFAEGGYTAGFHDDGRMFLRLNTTRQ